MQYLPEEYEEELEEYAADEGESEEDFAERRRRRPRRFRYPYYRRPTLPGPASRRAVQTAFVRTQADVANVRDRVADLREQTRTLDARGEGNALASAAQGLIHAIGSRTFTVENVPAAGVAAGGVLTLKENFNPINLVPLGVLMLLGSPQAKSLLRGNLLPLAVVGIATAFFLAQRK